MVRLKLDLVSFMPRHSNLRLSGDMVWLEALGQGIIVVGSFERAVDLLDRKSLNYSDRPSIPLMEL